MKRFAVFALVAAALFSAMPAGAVDSLTVVPDPIPPGTSAVPRISFSTPGGSAFFSGKTVACVIDVSKHYTPIASGSGAMVSTFVLATSLTAAADSMNFSLHVGPTASGPWTSVYAMGNATFSATGTTPFVLSSAVATTTLPPMPYWKITAKAKKTFTSAQKVTIVFPNPRTG